ncbi:hypothetical protein Tco_1127375 [Tanacetum coccineum]
MLASVMSGWKGVAAPLVFDGTDLKLISHDDFQVNTRHLILTGDFVLETVTKVLPQKNTFLEVEAKKVLPREDHNGLKPNQWQYSSITGPGGRTKKISVGGFTITDLRVTLRNTLIS